MARQTVPVPLHELTDRQIHLHLIGLYERQVDLLTRLEKHMADLSQSIEDLQAAVDGVNARVAGQVQVLTDALAAANQALADEALDDASREQALNDALAQIEAAANAIGEQTEELNGIGAEPEVPVVPEPPAEEGPHPDQTLPGDLPAE